jgi:hypothetical protein
MLMGPIGEGGGEGEEEEEEEECTPKRSMQNLPTFCIFRLF